MASGRARIVLLLLVCGALAAMAGSTVDQPAFDLVSGVEWAERVADGVPAAQGAPHQRPVPTPTIASGLILLAGGLIVTVVVLGLHANARVTPLRVRAP